MAQVLKLISYEAYDDEIEKLMALLRNLSIPIPDNAQITKEAIEAFKFFYYATFADERSTDLTIESARVHVGLGDLAAKITRASSKASPEVIRPHLEKMIQGADRMNENSCVTDDAANKTTELYIGCLALSGGWSISLDHPVSSSGGQNPDVIINRNNQQWAIAVKTIHGHASKTIFDNIAKATHQIEASGITGIAFIDLRNRIKLSAATAYANISEANAALCNEMVGIVQQLRDEIVDDDWLQTFQSKLARPVVAFIAQTVTSFRDLNLKEVFVPVRQIVSLTVPPLPKEEFRLSGLDLEALRLICDLNVELQASPEFLRLSMAEADHKQ